MIIFYLYNLNCIYLFAFVIKRLTMVYEKIEIITLTARFKAIYQKNIPDPQNKNAQINLMHEADLESVKYFLLQCSFDASKLSFG